ncbi:MAG: ABC transporter substrate-binding protein, partial [Proteobacteria bacterium]|nr:ABC transporter substrate-binding protein [Pseudomonadota bacterium]
MRMARVAAIVLALLTIMGCSKESDTIKIGAVLSVTGPASFLGEPEKNTLLMLQDELNAAGGVDGRKVQVIVYDDESDVNKCVMAAKKLIEQDKVAVVLGPSISGNTLAIAKFFAPAKIPLISCAAA